MTWEACMMDVRYRSGVAGDLRVGQGDLDLYLDIRVRRTPS